ncbi:MAG: M1 family metallopeptidase [Lentimicrobium sp.]|nr:M1 family metallopeptidase [Lentimicrobium sp.]
MQKLRVKYLFRHYVFPGLVLLWTALQASSQEYFQQEVHYKIDVTLDDREHALYGAERVEYINHSPDTLGFLYFHLWPNAYSNNQTALARQLMSMNGKEKLFNDPELMGRIDSLDFFVNGIQVRWNILPDSADICIITLNEPLKPGDTIQIDTPFHVKIPKGVTSRLGHIGESYQISQWYPKPAVYDRSGWHPMPYLDQAEFYSEFGSFDVSITLPDNYVVGATGNLQNEQEKRRLDEMAADTTWMKTIEGGWEYFPPSSGQMKTLRYTENQIHDFAWFADKRFHVINGSVILPDSKREVTTWVMFTNQEADLWKNAIAYVNDALLAFSQWIGDYPYSTFTAVQSALNSGAGMEYPGLTVIGLAKDPYLLDEVIAHEICHSWFYSALGSDERRFPYMDESMATAYESRYLEEKYPGKKLWEIGFKNRKLARLFQIDKIPAKRIQELEWLIPARRNLEQPINLTSTDYSYDNYGAIVYNKAAQGFNYLRAWLGDSLFDATMQDYFITWKNRHPQPQDLRVIFESHTTKDLSWFFDDFLGTAKKLDYKIIRVENGKLLVKNKGKLKAPLLIAGMTGDSVTSEFWTEGFEGEKWIDVRGETFSGVKIDPEHTMTEFYRLNNNISSSGIFRKADPVQFRFLYTLEDLEKHTVLYIPAVDYNSVDGFMAGVVLNNGTLLPKTVEYTIIPFYSFRNQGITGYGKISIQLAPAESRVRMASFSLEGEQFGAPGDQNYHRAKIGLALDFRPVNLIHPINHQVSGAWLAASDLQQIGLLMPAKMRSYVQIRYGIERPGLIHPFNTSVSFESGRSYLKSALEFNYTFSYNGKGRGLETKFFAGSMLIDKSDAPFYAFSVSGRRGSEQYLYQGFYPDRFNKLKESFWSRQMTLSEGGLVSPVNDSLGYSRWLCSLSISSSLPGFIPWIPVKPFATVLLNDHRAGPAASSRLFFEAGFKTGLWNAFEVYVPIIVSGHIKEIAGSFRERIRFVLKFDISR